MKQYKPYSHFFTDLSDLINAGSSGTDGFGPVDGSLTTKYRVTSKIKASSTRPLYAICDGKILIQPQTGDNTKINIIIKPAGNNYSPLKIKYFVYRGINKADYFTNDVLNQPGTGKPEILNKMWLQFTTFNALSSPVGIVFPLENVFNFSAPGTNLIDNAIQSSFITCKAGDYIGSFNSEIGLDIVLDHGEYTLENQEILFNFDLNYARSKEFIFDTDAITSGNVSKKRFKENIHQFLDAAAFWGSHINCGTIQYKNGTTVTDATNISEILKKYQTGNKVYIYLNGENNRSFNYYDTSRKIYGFNGVNSETNSTNGWPILIKSLSPPSTSGNVNIDIEFDYKIENSTYSEEPQRNISIDLIATNNFDLSSYPLVERPKISGQLPNLPASNALGKTKKIRVSYPTNSTGACANFTFLSSRIYQKFPEDNYFNNLWIANVKSSINFDTAVNKMHWATYDKNRNINLNDTFGESAILQNKVIFDEGENKSGIVPSKKRRRLYAAIVKNNSGKSEDNESLNVDKISSGYIEVNSSDSVYFMNIFNDPKYSIYKGTFLSGTTGTSTINSLCISNEDLILKKYSYMLLGITEDDYNKLIIPTGADNVFFDFQEIAFTTNNVRKFKLGLRFEDIAGNIITSYPSTGNEIYIYTLDGLFFFSEDYSNYQNFANSYPKAKADFRVQSSYNGDFGFDWMRVADTTAPGDVKYKDTIGKQYQDLTFTNVVTDINEDAGNFRNEINLFPKLEREYSMYPIQWENNHVVDKYYLQTLNIYPPYVSPSSGIDLDRQSIFTPPYDDNVNRVADLSLKIYIKSRPSRIFLQYDSTLINITPTLTIPTTIGQHTINLTLKAKQEINIDQYVKVIAVYGGKNKVIGQLKVSKNAKIARKSKKVVLLTVKTNINGVVEPSANDKALFLKKYLRQIFITPVIEKISLDLSSDSVFNTNYIYSITPTSKVLLSEDYNRPALQAIHDYVVSKNFPGTTTMIKNYYPDAYILIFFAESGGALKPPPTNYQGLNGYSSDRFIVGFKSARGETATHEFLHSADIPHSFTAYEADRFAKFTFKPTVTNNIMDYSHHVGINRRSLWEWQGKIARNNADNEP